MKKGWIGLAVVIMAVGCSKKDTIDPGTWNSYRNPVDQTDIQDPAVFTENGAFYMFSTGSSAESVIPMMVSSDLTTWEMAINIFTDETMPDFISGVLPQSPEIAQVGGKYLAVMAADLILVMDKGCIIGKGTHAELMESCPMYRELCELQLGGDAA